MLSANNSLYSVVHQTLLSNCHGFFSLICKNEEIQNHGNVGYTSLTLIFIVCFYSSYIECFINKGNEKLIGGYGSPPLL
jgi:hypothetical protein